MAAFLLEIRSAEGRWMPNLLDPHAYFRHMLNKGELHDHEMLNMAEYKERYLLVFEEIKKEIYCQGGASLDPPPMLKLDRRCIGMFWVYPTCFYRLIALQLLVRRKLIVPNRIRRRYLERRQKMLRDPTIKTKLFAFMGVKLSRRILIRNICANKIQRAYRGHQILLWVSRMKSSAIVIQCAYRRAKARELAFSQQWKDFVDHSRRRRLLLRRGD
jgi:hypothetical protein